MKSISRRLFDAIRAGDLDTTRELLQEGNMGTLDVNTKRPYNGCDQTPLHVACRRGKIHIVKHLVQETNANVNALDNLGRTPLYRACSCKKTAKKREASTAIVKFLLTNGAKNVNIRARWSANADTALHVACRCRNSHVVQELLDHGAEVNAQDDYGETPLFKACSYGPVNIDLIQLLLANNADRHIARKNGLGPMSLPCGEKQSLLQKRVFESYETLPLAVSTFAHTQQHEMADKKRKFTQQGGETVRLNPLLSQHQHALAIKALFLVRKLPVHEVAYEILGFLSSCAVEKMVLPTV